MNHLMIDIETMSTRADAAITQVAGVIFDPTTGVLGAEFNAYARLEDGQGHIDPGTVRWWLKQSDAARAALEEGQKTASGIEQVLDGFRHFWLVEKPLAIWSHGATFDIPIMAAAYTRWEMDPPWGYRDARDTRTLFDIVGKKLEELVPKREGTHHNALDDAKTQALAVAAAYRLLGK